MGRYILDINKSGSSQPYISLGALRELPILVPPLSEQTAIASILSSLDDKIDLLHRQNATLEKMAETLFRQWFVEEAKEEWETNILNEFISVKHGFAFKGTFITSEPNNLKLVTPGNFKIGGGFKADKFKYYTDLNFPNDYIFQTNDLIITMTDLSVDGDTLGSPAFIPESNLDELYLHNQRVGKVIFKKVISKYFLYNLMRTEDYKMYIHGSASGTSIRHTSPTTICLYLFVKPPNKLLEEYDKLVSPIYNKIKSNQSQIHTLTSLRDTLLPKLMSGEIMLKM
jgi:type I restriction enzyme S subunit